MSRKLVVVTVVSFLLGSGITYLVQNARVNKEKAYREEIGKMCAEVIDASTGVSRTCGEAYTTLVNCLDNKTCELEKFEELNNQKIIYENQVENKTKNIQPFDYPI